MAHLNQRRPENISGNFYVDRTCIDCDTCRWMAPDVFHQAGDQSAVYHQPANETERLSAMQALLSCPTASIGTVENQQISNSHKRAFQSRSPTISTIAAIMPRTPLVQLATLSIVQKEMYLSIRPASPRPLSDN